MSLGSPKRFATDLKREMYVNRELIETTTTERLENLTNTFRHMRLQYAIASEVFVFVPSIEYLNCENDMIHCGNELFFHVIGLCRIHQTIQKNVSDRYAPVVGDAPTKAILSRSLLFFPVSFSYVGQCLFTFVLRFHGQCITYPIAFDCLEKRRNGTAECCGWRHKYEALFLRRLVGQATQWESIHLQPMNCLCASEMYPFLVAFRSVYIGWSCVCVCVMCGDAMRFDVMWMS